MAPHSSTLAWKIPWTEEPGGLQSMGSWRVGHNWATSLSIFTFHFHALEKEMATHSNVLAWRIPGTVEPDGLLSMGLHRVGHDWSDLAAAAAAELGRKSSSIDWRQTHSSRSKISAHFSNNSLICASQQDAASPRFKAASATTACIFVTGYFS